MPSPYDVIVVGSGPAGGTAARYAARRGLKVLLVDKRKEIGVPVQCGEYVAHNEEIRSIFPDVEGLEDLMAVPYHVREVDTPVIRIWSPKGRRYEVPFKGFTVRRDRMDQGIAAQAVDEGAEIMTETTVVRVHGEEVATNHGTFQGKVVIGSDGPRSTVAKSVGLEWPVSAPAMSATADGDFSNSTDMFFGNLAPGGYAWIIPKAHCANVGLGTWQYFHGNLQSLFDRFVRSRGLEPGKATGGFVPVMGPPPRTVKDNAMLVGDAAGMVMATNGGGNNVAMIAGRIAGLTAADHLLAGTPPSAGPWSKVCASRSSRTDSSGATGSWRRRWSSSDDVGWRARSDVSASCSRPRRRSYRRRRYRRRNGWISSFSAAPLRSAAWG